MSFILINFCGVSSTVFDSFHWIFQLMFSLILAIKHSQFYMIVSLSLSLKEGYGPLHCALRTQTTHTYQIVELLLNHAANENLETQPDGDTPLHLAVRNIDSPEVEDIVLLLLDYGADYEAKNKVSRYSLSLISNMGPWANRISTSLLN